MPRIQIHTDTFIAGKPAFRGEILNVTNETATQLVEAQKAYVLAPDGKPKIEEPKAKLSPK